MNPTSRLRSGALLYALAALSASVGDTPLPRLSGFGKAVSGSPVDAGTPEGQPFQDHRGRWFVKDAKGTIRRCAPPAPQPAQT